ncbi:MAG TPA: GMC family oxidoreductase [Leptospiraceae bacterium]|nr:GMC family oxidoreductase [Leptospirales bacterium]HMU82288.1 GMC family oxidoreductase [Leptospiraceae bacterium]HMX57247.1 GMC family oxidoreductase [Leptospiraceae bacterium]HMY45331.1 GMC family oxidoreductase [Leptospiraceae bacterium]HNJ33891.1 GMC family oxidoreductase [Leptospiraceae bacterium]
MENANLEFDYVIIGSGFGGSVSAMRLAQKGYSVAVLEAGKRWEGKDFPKTNWSLRKFLWMPKAFCYGIQRINVLNDVMILSGAGVGGGSLVYANTLYVPKKEVFEYPLMKKMGGQRHMLPFFQIAQKMLGVITNPALTEVDELMKQTAAELGKGDTFTPTPVGIYFGEAGKTVKDPYFGGEGPDRTGCNFCGGCMVGCRFDAKNTLDKNYLYFAEKLGVKVFPETKAVDIIPLSADGSAGYEIRTKRTTGFFGLPNRTFRAKGIVFSAGVLGTMKLLLTMQETGRLTRLSGRVGHMVRTNSEAIVGATSLSSKVDYSKGIAITSSVHPEEHTHIEPVRYSRGSDAMGSLASVLTDGGGKIPRQIRFLGNVIRHPIQFLRTIHPIGFAKKSIILLVMQTLDNHIHIVNKRRLIWPFSKSLSSEQEDAHDRKIPTYIPMANEFARRLAKRIGGIPRSSYNEVLLNIPTTAHILGGACMGETPEDGVVDTQNRVFGYQNMLVCDGSMVPVNLGVNPSLTITAFTERAMSFIPPKEKSVQAFKFEKKWGITSRLTENVKKGGFRLKFW